MLARLLVLIAVGPLAVHAAVLDETAGRAVLEPDGVAPLLATVGAGFDRDVTHAATHRADRVHKLNNGVPSVQTSRPPPPTTETNSR